jgi:hypothetical protein
MWMRSRHGTVPHAVGQPLIGSSASSTVDTGPGRWRPGASALGVEGARGSLAKSLRNSAGDGGSRSGSRPAVEARLVTDSASVTTPRRVWVSVVALWAKKSPLACAEVVPGCALLAGATGLPPPLLASMAPPPAASWRRDAQPFAMTATGRGGLRRLHLPQPVPGSVPRRARGRLAPGSVRLSRQCQPFSGGSLADRLHVVPGFDEGNSYRRLHHARTRRGTFKSKRRSAPSRFAYPRPGNSGALSIDVTLQSTEIWPPPATTPAN